MFLPLPVFAMKMKLLAAWCAAMLLSTPAFAADDGTDSSATTLKEVQAFVVQRDGSFVLDHEVLVQLNEQRAVGAQAQRQFHFNRTLEDIDVLEAYTENRTAAASRCSRTRSSCSRNRPTAARRCSRTCRSSR